MPKNTRKVLVDVNALYKQYEFLTSRDNTGSATSEYRAYAEALQAYMEALQETETQRMNRAKREELMRLYSTMNARRQDVVTPGMGLFFDQRQKIEQGMQVMDDSLSALNNVIKSTDPTKKAMKLDDMLSEVGHKEQIHEKEERERPVREAADLRSLLSKKTSRIRGTSKNFKAVEKALETLMEKGEATKKDLLAVKAAAERYLFEKERSIRERDKAKNSYERDRIEAVKKVLAYANRGLERDPAENRLQRAEDKLTAEEATSDIGIEKVVQYYKPKPEFGEDIPFQVDPNDPRRHSGCGISQEQLDGLTRFDTENLKIGGKPLTDKDFAAASVMSVLNTDIGGKYMSAKNVSLEPVLVDKPDPLYAMINASPYILDIGNTVGPRDGCGFMFKKVNNVGREATFQAFQEYNAGKPEKLAKLLCGGIKNTLEYTNHFDDFSNAKQTMSRDQLILDGLMLHSLDMLKSDPKLLALASKNGLTKAHFKKAEGLRRMSEIEKKAVAAAEMLAMDGKLTKEEQEGFLTSAENIQYRTGKMTEQDKKKLMDGRKLSPEDAERMRQARTLTKEERAACIDALLRQRTMFRTTKDMLKDQSAALSKMSDNWSLLDDTEYLQKTANDPAELKRLHVDPELSEDKRVEKLKEIIRNNNEGLEEEPGVTPEKIELERRKYENNKRVKQLDEDPGRIALSDKMSDTGNEITKMELDLEKLKKGEKPESGLSKEEINKQLSIKRAEMKQMNDALSDAQTGIPPLVEELGGKGCLAKLTQQVNEQFPNKSALYEMTSQEALKILNDPKFIIPDEEAKEKYGKFYNQPEEPKLEQKQTTKTEEPKLEQKQTTKTAEHENTRKTGSVSLPQAM